jgi:hypothetical protein
MQYFRPRRAHARAFAGREHNGKAGAFKRQWTSSAAGRPPAPSYPSASLRKR